MTALVALGVAGVKPWSDLFGFGGDHEPKGDDPLFWVILVLALIILLALLILLAWS